MGADQKRREARKRKFGDRAGPAGPASPASPASPLLESAVASLVPISKSPEQGAPKVKRKRSSKMENDSVGATLSDNGEVDADATAPLQPKGEQEGTTQHPAEEKNQRFIVFIGNLPFTATDESIAKHFAKVHPKSIRHRTDRTNEKSKGFAFLEFEGYDRMKTCLKLYHHSTFEDGVSPARRLNVELTVGGGGGKSKIRKAKLREKNVKLNEERQRRAEEEEKRTKAVGRKQGTKGPKEAATGPEKKAAESPAGPSEQEGDIHPSRRARMAKT